MHPKGMLGKHLSEETKNQISVTLQGREITPEHRNKISNGLKNVPKSEEHSKKISETKKEYYKDKNNRPNCSKWIKIIYPDGTEYVYRTIKECLESLSISYTIYKKLINTNISYETKMKRNQHLNGIKLIELDNTEIS
jgi:protein-tyrosine phosphatase